MSSFAYLPGVYPAEQDKSIVPSVTPGDLRAVAVVDTDWGPPELTFLESPQDLVTKYTWNGKPDISDRNWQSAYYMLKNGAPLYLKRTLGDGALSGGMLIKESTASGANAALSSGVVWANAASYTFDVEDLFLIVFYPGVYGNNFKVTIDNAVVATYEFDILFYRTVSGVDTLLETIRVSRKHKVDGLGRNIYIEDRVEDYTVPFQIIDNTAFADTVMPQESSLITSAGGSNGSAVDAADIVAEWNLLGADGGAEAWRLMLTFGWTDTTVGAALTTIAGARDYTVAIIDAPSDTLANLIVWNTALSLNSSRVGKFAEYHQQLDSFNGVSLYLPPSAVIGALIINNRATNPWKPFAGLRRGVFITTGLENSYTKSQMDSILALQINPLTRFGGAYILMDNLSALTYKSALSNLNTRLLFDFITESAVSFLMAYVQEYNDEETREAVRDGLQRILDVLIDDGSLVDGAAQCNGENNTAPIIDSEKLVADMYIKPPKAAKQIHVNLIAVSTGVEITVT